MKKAMKRASVAAVTAVALIIGLLGTWPAVNKAEDVEINEETFGTLLKYAQDKDANEDGILSSEEASEVTGIYFDYDEELQDISGLVKYFPNLTEVSINVGNAGKLVVNHNKISTMTLYAKGTVSIEGAQPTKIVYHSINNTSSFDFSKAKGYEKVKTFQFSGSQNQQVVPPNQADLETLQVYNTAMKSVDLSKMSKLKQLDLSENKLTSLNVKKNTKLVSLACYNNKVSTLNLSSNKELKDIGIGVNKIKTLDVEKNKKLVQISAYQNQLKTLKTGKGNKLSVLRLSKNKLTSMKPASFKSLQDLEVNSNKLKALDVTKNKKLVRLNCGGNAIKSLNLKNNKKLLEINVAKTSLKKLPLPKGVKLQYISVGSKINLLKKIPLKQEYTIINMQLADNKKYQLTKIMPSLKGFEFTTYSEKVKVTKSGVVTTKKMGKGNGDVSVNGTKGNKGVYICLNSSGVY